MSKKPTFKNGILVVEVPMECRLCGEIFTTTNFTFQENQDPHWCELFECCTQDCLERAYNYDEFKKHFKYKVHAGLINRQDWDLEWSIWIKAIRFDENPSNPEMGEILQMEHDGIVSDFRMQLFSIQGMPLDQAEWLSWSDISPHVWVTTTDWGISGSLISIGPLEGK